MLQRLPGLGRVRAESDDRQFIDGYILDGLRAVDLLECVASHPPKVPEAVWRNPLDKLGQRIFAAGIKSRERGAIQHATRCASLQNRVLASDVIASLVWTQHEEFDYRNFALDEGQFILLDMSRVTLKNLRITNSTFFNLVFPREQPVNVYLRSSHIDRAFGVTSMNGMPPWAAECIVEKFESAENISRIRQIGLKPGLGYPFNRTWRFVSKGGSAKVAPSWADVRVVSAAWEEQALGSGS